MSNGHGSPLIYAMLHLCGVLDVHDLKSFIELDSRTPLHPEMDKTPGVDMTTGPLGEGIATAVGNQKQMCVCVGCGTRPLQERERERERERETCDALDPCIYNV